MLFILKQNYSILFHQEEAQEEMFLSLVAHTLNSTTTISFLPVSYLGIKKDSGVSNFTYQPVPDYVSNFPVGIAKDIRVVTYYAVVGTSTTKNIPFNIFFGDGGADDTVSEVVPFSGCRRGKAFWK